MSAGAPLNRWATVALSDEQLFSFESGTWSGEKPPLVGCPVLRNTNFTNDGRLDFSNVAVIPIEQRLLERKRLSRGRGVKPADRSSFAIREALHVDSPQSSAD